MFVERPLFPPFKLRNCGADARYKRDDWPIVPWPMAPKGGRRVAARVAAGIAVNSDWQIATHGSVASRMICKCWPRLRGCPTPSEAGDLPRGSQEEGRRHGGRRPIKVYALHSCQRRIGLEFGGARGPSLKPDLNPSKPVPSTRMRTVSEGSLDLFD